MRKYLEPYKEGSSYDLFRLIHDDHLRGPQLLWNNSLRMPAVKLLLSTLDTLAFISFGDRQRNFQDWVDKYFALKKLNVTADELWEFRNSLLHMNNNTSRKVASGLVRPIIPYFGGGTLPEEYTGDSPVAAMMDGDMFVTEVLNSINVFCESIKADPTQLEIVLQGYDKVFSDARYLDISSAPFREIQF